MFIDGRLRQGRQRAAATRNGVIFFLGQSPNVYIEMPTANRMSF